MINSNSFIDHLTFAKCLNTVSTSIAVKMVATEAFDTAIVVALGIIVIIAATMGISFLDSHLLVLQRQLLEEGQRNSFT